jgi:prepilin-type N-terminal cleavage/methylation domain-containing protein
MTKARGFTLIEVVVAIAILAVLSMYSAQAIHRAVHAKVKIEKDIDRVSVVREAMKVMERDINLAFNYRDINVDLYNAVGAARQQAQQTKTTPQAGVNNPSVTPAQAAQTGQQAPLAPFVPKKQILLTQFMGSEKDLYFTTVSNIRTQADVQESDQSAVGYFLKDCSNWINKSLHSNCLIRRVNPILTDDVTTGGVETPLLENVTRFELRYLGPGKEKEWIKDWYSDGKGGEDWMKGKFPYAVEITIETRNKNIENDKPTAMTWVAALRFPNNPEPSASPPVPGANPGVTNGQPAATPPPIH